MSGRLDAFFEFVRRGLVEPLGRLGGLMVAGCRSLAAGLWRFRWRFVTATALILIACGLLTHPPFDSVRRGEVLARTDALNGSVSIYSAGTILVLPGIHQVRRYSIRDQVYRPTESASATGAAPFQSVEGLSIGVDPCSRSKAGANSGYFTKGLEAGRSMCCRRGSTIRKKATSILRATRRVPGVCSSREK
jgi:hypothetical protein